MDEIRDVQRQTWNRFSAGWDKWDEFVLGWLAPVGDALIAAAGVKEGARVLDAATGTGDPGLTAARRVGTTGHVIGIDLAEDMVALANDNARRRGLGNYRAQVADCTRLPFADASFDAVLCRFGIMFFPVPGDGCREVLRVLAPAGRVAFAVWGAPEKNPWITTASGIVARELGLPPPPPEAPGIFRFAAAERLADLFADCGFGDIRTTAVTGTTRFVPPERYWELMCDVVAPVAMALAGADATARARVDQAVAAAVSERARDGALSLDWQAWVVSAAKM